MRALLLVGVILALAGCNAYSINYKPTITTEQLAASRQLVPYEGEPQVRLGAGDPYADFLRQLEDGWALIGTSTFNAVDTGLWQAGAQGKAVKAEQVIVYKSRTGTSTNHIPVTTPTTQSSQVYGAGPTGTIYSGTVTTYGSRTDYMPYTTTLYDHLATYWVRRRPGGLGAFMRDMEPAEKQKLGSNRGVAIIAVARNSSAYRADLVPGDIVTEIDGRPVDDFQSSRALLPGIFGRTVNFKVFRNGTFVTKPVAVDPEIL